jgi:hypothetical protein
MQPGEDLARTGREAGIFLNGELICTPEMASRLHAPVFPTLENTMRRCARCVFVIYMLSCLFVFAQEKKSAVPVLTDAQKLEIRTAQVEMFQAKSVLESTPQYKAFLNAQEKMNEIALRVQREAKVDPSKFQLGQDLNFTAVPQPQEKK